MAFEGAGFEHGRKRGGVEFLCDVVNTVHHCSCTRVKGRINVEDMRFFSMGEVNVNPRSPRRFCHHPVAVGRRRLSRLRRANRLLVVLRRPLYGWNCSVGDLSSLERVECEPKECVYKRLMVSNL